MLMNRRDALGVLALLAVRPRAASGVHAHRDRHAGYSDREVNDPYGLVIGPDGALYFCDLGNQRIRRLDLKTAPHVHDRRQRQARGTKATGPGAGRVAEHAARDPVRRGRQSLHRRARQSLHPEDRREDGHHLDAGRDRRAGFSGDGGPASQAQLRQPHAIALDPAGGLLICDVGNHRVRRVDLESGSIDTYAGTGERHRPPTARR